MTATLRIGSHSHNQKVADQRPHKYGATVKVANVTAATLKTGATAVESMCFHITTVLRINRREHSPSVTSVFLINRNRVQTGWVLLSRETTLVAQRDVQGNRTADFLQPGRKPKLRLYVNASEHLIRPHRVSQLTAWCE